jgi:hypothetical protein
VSWCSRVNDRQGSAVSSQQSTLVNDVHDVHDVDDVDDVEDVGAW